MTRTSYSRLEPMDSWASRTLPAAADYYDFANMMYYYSWSHCPVCPCLCAFFSDAALFSLWKKDKIRRLSELPPPPTTSATPILPPRSKKIRWIFPATCNRRYRPYQNKETAEKMVAMVAKMVAKMVAVVVKMRMKR